MVAATRRVRGAGEDGADHHRIGARGERLGDVTPDSHTAIGDDLDAAATLVQPGFARGGDVTGRGHLRHADTEHTSSGAGGTWTDPDQDAGDAGLHQLQRGLVVDAVAGDDRNRQ